MRACHCLYDESHCALHPRYDFRGAVVFLCFVGRNHRDSDELRILPVPVTRTRRKVDATPRWSIESVTGTLTRLQ